MEEDIIKFAKEERTLIKVIYESCIGEEVTLNQCCEKYKKEYKPEDILVDREERVYRQEELLEKYENTLLTIRVNYPGINKNNHISLSIILVLCNLAIKEFNNRILFKEFNINAEGPTVTMIINEDSNKVKIKAVDIEENHLLGRCVDIDVYDKRGKGLSRRELGLAQRKCYICSDFAQNCVRSRKHDMHEIKEFIKNKFEYYCEVAESKLKK